MGWLASLKKSRAVASVIRWIDAEAGADTLDAESDRVDLLRVLPFIVLHLAVFLVFWVGVSAVAVWAAVGLFVVRMLAVTGIYHRYFSHRTYRLNRFWQFVAALLGNSAVQRGPLWWAAHHRHHHRCADQPGDPHSPKQLGFWRAHVLWLTTPKNFPTRRKYVEDWMRFPELVFLNRFSMLVPLGLLGLCLLAGWLLGTFVPSTGTSALQMGVWGFVISTVALFHATATINSLDHMIGTRRYDTPDTSRNNFILAILTMGEGWHNNHHHYASTARQGFYWWQWDPTYYLLVVLSWVGIVKDLKPLPAEARARGQIRRRMDQESV
ncbi:MAG: acyl-CoA desaturase [Phycisphaerae bacterium]